jgi:hypothetical protein
VALRELSAPLQDFNTIQVTSKKNKVAGQSFVSYAAVGDDEAEERIVSAWTVQRLALKGAPIQPSINLRIGDLKSFSSVGLAMQVGSAFFLPGDVLPASVFCRGANLTIQVTGGNLFTSVLSNEGKIARIAVKASKFNGVSQGDFSAPPAPLTPPRASRRAT